MKDRGSGDEKDDQLVDAKREELYARDRARAQSLHEMARERRAGMWGSAMPDPAPAGELEYDHTLYQHGFMHTLLDCDRPVHFNSRLLSGRWEFKPRKG